MLETKATRHDIDHDAKISAHYGLEDLEERILRALAEVGANPDKLTTADLAPIDELHIRGLEATKRLAELLQPTGNEEILDVGSGIGGSARYLAEQRGCRVTGIDLTERFVQIARSLSRRCGMDGRVRFECASALDVPFEDARFDLVWTEHAQMNIEDKDAFYAEIVRVLKPGGRFACHDIFSGSGPIVFPVPWAATAELSHVAAPGRARRAMETAGLRIETWQETTGDSLAWANAILARVREQGPPPVGLHLLMGPAARVKLENLLANLAQGRIRTIMAVACKAA